jgi:large conductance mechanosensitive channel
VIQEFRDFIDKGNFVDLAVAFVMGVAFTAVVTALNERVVTPAVGLLFNVDGLDQWGTFAGGEGSIGAFLEAMINFVIVGVAMFLVVRTYNRFRAAEEPPASAEDVELLREIRDELRASRGGTTTT